MLLHRLPEVGAFGLLAMRNAVPVLSGLVTSFFASPSGDRVVSLQRAEL